MPCDFQIFPLIIVRLFSRFSLKIHCHIGSVNCAVWYEGAEYIVSGDIEVYMDGQ